MPELRDNAIKTYRYLRLAMFILIITLAVSLLIEWSKTKNSCFQTSVSAYYYTPVQAIFVGSLIAIGVSMVALKGNTEGEDVLLNVAGMLAPAVALVPTPGMGTCRSVPVVLRDTPTDIANNMSALFVAGVLAFGISVGLAVKARRLGIDRSRSGGRGAGQRSDRRHTAGLVVAGVVLFGGILWFWLNRPGFSGHAHYTAAILLFACIIAVVGLNARDSRPLFAGLYLIIAVAMVASAVGMGLYQRWHEWDHSVLWIEGTLIALFAIFWLIQTVELWSDGLRPEGQEAAIQESGKSLVASQAS
jgi:hypothetical protein